MKRMMFVLVSIVMVAQHAAGWLRPCRHSHCCTGHASTSPATAAPATAAPAATATSAPVCAAKGTAAIPFPSSGKTVTIAFSQEPDLVDALFSSVLTPPGWLRQPWLAWALGMPTRTWCPSWPRTSRPPRMVASLQMA